MKEFDEKTERFAREVSTGTFPFSPLYPRQCLGCKYDKVCRALYRIK